MKIIIFDTRSYEIESFNYFAKELNLELTFVSDYLNIKTVHLTKGYEGVAILGFCDASAKILEILAQNGVKYLGTRSIGYNHIDLNKAKELNIRVSNATYSPNSVSEFTIMMILMLNRKAKRIIDDATIYNYSLQNKMGTQINNQTIGIIGTGKIGSRVIKALSGFGCKIVCYDIFENKDVLNYATYVSLDELFNVSDVISLHTPLNNETYHLINDLSISKMKDKVKIINCARGGLVDTNALIRGLKSNKISGCALDVVEEDSTVFHVDYSKVGHNVNAINQLEQMSQVILTPHTAFFTDQAAKDMTECVLRSLHSFKYTNNSIWEVKI